MRSAPNRIYLDNNATTPMLPEVAEAMAPYLSGLSGNPASAHQEGRQARRALEDAREQIAEILGASADEVIFTSGATEANNLAIQGLCGSPPSHLLSSRLEHPCVVEPLLALGQNGYEVEWLPVSPSGTVSLSGLAEKLKPETSLIAIMLVNHETGVIQPVQEAVQLLEKHEQPVAVHCDAVQAVGKVPLSFHDLGVASLSVSAHKFHGPKGIGALLLRSGQKLKPLLRGGHQQQGHRPGTESVAPVVGMATALQIAQGQMQERWQHITGLRERFLEVLKGSGEPWGINGSEEEAAQLPYCVNLSFPGLKADALLMNFDLAGIACSTGSACSSGSLLPSPVLQAMEVSPERLESAMRFSFSPLLAQEEVEESARRIVEVLQRLRQIEE